MSQQFTIHTQWSFELLRYRLQNNCVKLSGLDPDYYYQIAEDVWGWSYDYQDNGVKYTVGEGIQNPFVFINVPKEEIKEAEAVVRNIFYTKEGTKPANRQ